MTDLPSSRYIIRSVGGLAVAIAGFPDKTPIKGDLDGFTIVDLRALKELPGILEVLIPCRFLDDSVVTVNLLEWNAGSEK
jgi:hypothetical protein